MLLSLVVLALAGARVVIFGAEAPPPVQTGPSGPVLDAAAQNFAADFTRTYLTYGRTIESREAREQQLSYFPLATGTKADYGMTLPEEKAQTVVDVAVAQVGPTSRPDVTNYTVQAILDTGTSLYLSVPVLRTDDGLALAAFPSFIGAPASASEVSDLRGGSVRDETLRTMIARAMPNYLEGNAEDLEADLTRDANIGLPSLELTAGRVETPRWIAPDADSTVSVTTQATDARGATYSLTYEVDLARANGRWYIRAIQALPTTS